MRWRHLHTAGGWSVADNREIPIMKYLSKLPLVLGAAALMAGTLQLSLPAVASAGDCEDRCAHWARERFERCVNAGHDRERCARWARDQYRRCVREHC